MPLQAPGTARPGTRGGAGPSTGAGIHNCFIFMKHLNRNVKSVFCQDIHINLPLSNQVLYG